MPSNDIQYPTQNPMHLDRKGGYYIRHINAMTAENLHDKSDIAEQLAWRDAEIDRLNNELQNRAPSDEGTTADAYFYCTDLIDPWLGEKCGPDTLINSVCESLQFLIENWRLQRDLMREAYLAGWQESAEGYNSEHEPQAPKTKDWADQRDAWVEQKLREATDVLK